MACVTNEPILFMSDFPPFSVFLLMRGRDRDPMTRHPDLIQLALQRRVFLLKLCPWVCSCGVSVTGVFSCFQSTDFGVSRGSYNMSAFSHSRAENATFSPCQDPNSDTREEPSACVRGS